MKAKFDAMGVLERKIDATLEKSIGKMLGEGAREIGYAMGRDIADSAKAVLNANGALHCLRGQIWVVGFMTLFATVGYWLGREDVFSREGDVGFFRAFFRIPASGVAFICGLAYVGFWYLDCWDWAKERPFQVVKFMLQILILLGLLLHVFG
jgi:hypothetical protein